MFHELLMALSGFVGDVFRPDGDGVIKIRKDISFPFIHPGEVAIIDEILEIGTMFKYLEDFVQEHQLLNYAGKPKAKPHGLYVTALCNGLRTILDEYLDVIADLELKVIEDMNLTLNHLRAEVETYRELFASLSLLVKKVLSQEQSSTVIVELVKSEFDEKLHLQDSLQKLIPWINGVLFKQMTNWMVYGTLNDPFNEFFIQPRKMDLSDSDSNKTGKAVSYFVNFAVVPSYFPVSLMDKILFVGMGISILEKSDRTRSIAMEHQQLFHSKMKSVNLDTFRLEKLSNTVDELAASIGTVLHQIVVNEAGLVKHLGIIKDFYLTGRGELFHDFLSSIKPLIVLKSPFMLSALRRSFAVSAARVQLQDEVVQKIQLNFPTGPRKNYLHDYTLYNKHIDFHA
ncbi:unnamed protein product [Allacma fusca]|uniref:Gamma-tubulin complex component n=1 Tax=Allacma fusca TaxID=39272 RepID=A0A8J2KQB5_9HEXA|nr:unnamed protein product [Allacma fusca]